MKNIARENCSYGIFDMRHGFRLDFYIIYFHLYGSDVWSANKYVDGDHEDKRNDKNDRTGSLLV